MDRFVKLFEIDEKGISGTRLVNKEEAERLRGKIVIINPNPEECEIAKRLNITEKGVYGARFR